MAIKRNTTAIIATRLRRIRGRRSAPQTAGATKVRHRNRLRRPLIHADAWIEPSIHEVSNQIKKEY